MRLVSEGLNQKFGKDSLFVIERSPLQVKLPAGAQELGYKNCIINERPVSCDVTGEKSGEYKWFSGQWYKRKPPELDHYRTVSGILAIRQGGDLVSTPRDFKTDGTLPLLSGEKGFYVEVDACLSGNRKDFFPAIWLMPVEHCGKKDDHYEGDPDDFERWMELDIDEGGLD